MKAVTSAAASSMCWLRMGSAAFILRDGGRDNLGPAIPAQILRGPQVHLASNNAGQLHLHSRERNQTRHVPGFEFDQDVRTLSGRKRGVKTEPNRGSLWMWFRSQNSLRNCLGIARGSVGIGMPSSSE